MSGTSPNDVADLAGGVVLRVREDGCDVVTRGDLITAGYAPSFPSPRTERVSPGHRVALATRANGRAVVLWRWYDAVVVGFEGRSTRLWEPAHGEVLATAPRQRDRPRARLPGLRVGGTPRGGLAGGLHGGDRRGRARRGRRPLHRARLVGRSAGERFVSSAASAGFDVICWDWNGTLLDDASVARAAMNEVLQERGLPIIPDVEAYRRVFGFPVQAFYARLGIGEDDFRAAAGRYLELFASHVGEAPLHADAEAVLATIDRLGVAQVLISATIPTVLERQMAPHDLARHFDHVVGITDAYAPSKADVVARWLRSSGHDPGRVLMVGDTNHDEEIAEELEVGFVRFAHGHQAPPDHGRHPIVERLRDVVPHARAEDLRTGDVRRAT